MLEQKPFCFYFVRVILSKELDFRRESTVGALVLFNNAKKEVSGTAVIFQVGERRLALLVEQVERVLRSVEITPLLDDSVPILGVIDVEGTLIPVGDVQSLLGQDKLQIGLEHFIIIGIVDQMRIALVADKVEGTLTYEDDQFVRIKGADRDFRTEGVVNISDELVMVCDLKGCFPPEKFHLSENTFRSSN